MAGAGLWKKIGCGWGVIVILSIAAIGLLPIFSGTTPRSAEVREVSRLKTLLLACRAYAADHEGEYPDSLELLIPDYLSDDTALNSVSETGTSLPFLYFPERLDAPDPKPPIIVGPHDWNGKRNVGYQGGHIGFE